MWHSEQLYNSTVNDAVNGSIFSSTHADFVFIFLLCALFYKFISNANHTLSVYKKKSSLQSS